MKKTLLNLRIAAVGLGILFSTNISAQLTAVASGDWSSSATWGGTAPSSTVSGQNITIPSGITVTLDQDVTFTGLLNTFAVNGVLTNTTSHGIYMTSGNLAGTGTVTVAKLSFSLLGTVTYAGMMNVKHFVTALNSSSTLAFASMANISDTLELESGKLGLNTNGNLTMAAGSTVKVRDGLININSGIFNSGNAYNVMYVGSSKTAGVELNSITIQNLYLKMDNNNQTLTLANNSIINGNLDMSAGKLKISGKKLTLKGDVMMTAGTLIDSDAASDLMIEGSGSTTNSLMFVTGASIHELTINRTSTGMVKLGSALSISDRLNLMEGNFSMENGGALTSTSGSIIHVEKGMLSVNGGTFTGASGYNVEYAGTTDITSGTELTTNVTSVGVNFTTNTNKVVLSSNLIVEASLTLMNGKIDLNGKNLTLKGSMIQNSNALFIGNPASELYLNLTSVNQNTLYFDNTNASSQTLGKLSINTTGSVSVVLGTKLMINNELAFIKGKIELGNGDLEIMPSATISGYDDTKYVVTSSNGSGVLIQQVSSGAAYVTFPVGLSSNYSPAYVQQTSTGTTGNFSAKCEAMVNSSLKTVNRTWMVEGAGVTTIDANLKFGWKAASEINAFDRTNAYVSHYTNSMWDVAAATSATAGVNGTFELSRMGLTSLSPFAVVEAGQTVGVKEIAKQSNFEVYPNPSKDVINVKVSNSSDEYQYELIDVTGRTILSTSNTNSVNKFDVTNLGAGCYFVKITNLADSKTTTKRFIKQ